MNLEILSTQIVKKRRLFLAPCLCTETGIDPEQGGSHIGTYHALAVSVPAPTALPDPERQHNFDPYYIQTI